MKSIAIDMDEVIADISPRFLELYHRDFNTPLDIQLKPGQEIYEVMPPEAQDKWVEYIHAPGFFKDLPVMPDSQRVVQALQQQYEVYIVSAATEFRNSLIDKLDWLNLHFPFISWQHIVFCGKKIVNTDIIIDDRTKNFVDFKGRKILYSAPHNLLIKDIERVHNWQEVADKLL